MFDSTYDPENHIRPGIYGPIALDARGDDLTRECDEEDLADEVWEGRAPSFIRFSADCAGIDFWAVEASGDDKKDFLRGMAMAEDLVSYVHGSGDDTSYSSRCLRLVAIRRTLEDMLIKSQGASGALQLGFMTKLSVYLAGV